MGVDVYNNVASEHQRTSRSPTNELAQHYSSDCTAVGLVHSFTADLQCPAIPNPSEDGGPWYWLYSFWFCATHAHQGCREITPEQAS